MPLPAATRSQLVRLLGWLLRAFFRRVEIAGQENVPAAGGGILVAWHPNGLVDGLLILSSCPRPVVFGARHGLFAVPGLGTLLRTLGCVPLYRRQDLDAGASDEERQAANINSLRDLANAARTSFAGIFPEGATHDESQPTELRFGAARLYYAVDAATPEGEPRPSIVPVGLHYDKKHAFRSRALVVFHPPLEITEALDGRGEGALSPEERVPALTSSIETALNEVVHATESWELHHSMERIRKVVRAERSARAGVRLDASDMSEREMGFKRVWVSYNTLRETQPEQIDRLMARVRRYDLMMQMLRLEDRDLDRNYRGRLIRRLLRLVIEGTLVVLFLPTILFFGYLVNLPAALALKRIARGLSKTRKEQAGLKVMLGVVLFPLTWLAVGLVVAFVRPDFWTRTPWTPQTPLLAAAAVFVICGVSGALALRYHRMGAELLRNLDTFRARSARMESVRRLRERRSRLFDEAMVLSEDLDLPGEVAPDGRIVRD